MKNCEISVVLELGSCKRGDSGRSKTKSIGNRFRMLSPLLPAPSPLFLLLLLLLQSLRDFTIPTALSSAATQRCTSTTAGRKSATVASATTRSRCGRGMRWPQTTLWSLAGCFDEEEKRDDRKEEDDAPAMSQAEGKASLRASREAWGGRQEGQERSEEWNRCPQLDFFFFIHFSGKKNKRENEGGILFSLLSSLFLHSAFSSKTMFIIPAAATSCAASLAASCACWSAGALGRTIASRSARLAYVLFFSVSLLLAWVLRLGAEPLVKHLPCECSRGCCCCGTGKEQRKERENAPRERNTDEEGKNVIGFVVGRRQRRLLLVDLDLFLVSL